MKKLNILFASLIMAAVLFSCSKQMTENNDLSALGGKKMAVTNVASSPESDGEIIPYIIYGANRGGNRTCAEVAIAFETTFDLCGDRINYGNYDADMDNEWDGEFPEGLDVTVEGNFISFSMGSTCIKIGDLYYKVGAVIVKGSNAANVYYYPNGTLSDAGLAAPGGSAMVSNLTFCFVECDAPPQWVIALKTYIQTTETWHYAVSDGEGSAVNTLFIGYNNYVPNGTNVYPLNYMWNQGQIGTITASDLWENGIHYLKVVIDFDAAHSDWSFRHSYLYVGTLAGYNAYLTLLGNGQYETKYATFPFQQDDIVESRIFMIPFSEITQ